MSHEEEDSVAGVLGDPELDLDVEVFLDGGVVVQCHTNITLPVKPAMQVKTFLAKDHGSLVVCSMDESEKNAMLLWT